MLKRQETGNIQEESICEGEINREELPSFHLTKNLNRMTRFKEYRLETENRTPVSDYFRKLKELKESSQKSKILAKIIRKLMKGISRTDRQKLWGII